MEPRAAAERRDVDHPVQPIPQQAGQQMLDRMQAGGGDLSLVRLDESHVEVRDGIAPGAALDGDEADVGCDDGGVVQREALDVGHGLLLQRSVVV